MKIKTPGTHRLSKQSDSHSSRTEFTDGFISSQHVADLEGRTAHHRENLTCRTPERPGLENQRRRIQRYPFF